MRTLRELLERAEAGEFSGLMVIAEIAGTSNVLTSYTAAYDALTRLGMLELVKADWIRSFTE